MVDAKDDKRMNGESKADARMSGHDFTHILPWTVTCPGNDWWEQWADSESR